MVGEDSGSLHMDDLAGVQQHSAKSREVVFGDQFPARRDFGLRCLAGVAKFEGTVDLLTGILGRLALHSLGEECRHVERETVVQHRQGLKRRRCTGTFRRRERTVRLIEIGHQTTYYTAVAVVVSEGTAAGTAVGVVESEGTAAGTTVEFGLSVGSGVAVGVGSDPEHATPIAANTITTPMINERFNIRTFRLISGKLTQRLVRRIRYAVRS